MLGGVFVSFKKVRKERIPVRGLKLNSSSLRQLNIFGFMSQKRTNPREGTETTPGNHPSAHVPLNRTGPIRMLRYGGIGWPSMDPIRITNQREVAYLTSCTTTLCLNQHYEEKAGIEAQGNQRRETSRRSAGLPRVSLFPPSPSQSLNAAPYRHYYGRNHPRPTCAAIASAR